jgi:hypothetical protein
VVEDDNLSVEGSGFLGGVVLGVRRDVPSASILDGHVLDVEADVVTGKTSLELLMMHFDGLDLRSHVGTRERDDHAALDRPSLHTADGHGTDTADLVHILEWKSEGLVRWTSWGFDGVDGVQEGLALDKTALRLLSLALVPRHATRAGSELK